MWQEPSFTAELSPALFFADSICLAVSAAFNEPRSTTGIRWRHYGPGESSIIQISSSQSVNNFHWVTDCVVKKII